MWLHHLIVSVWFWDTELQNQKYVLSTLETIHIRPIYDFGWSFYWHWWCHVVVGSTCPSPLSLYLSLSLSQVGGYGWLRRIGRGGEQRGLGGHRVGTLASTSLGRVHGRAPTLGRVSNTPNLIHNPLGQHDTPNAGLGRTVLAFWWPGTNFYWGLFNNKKIATKDSSRCTKQRYSNLV
jgi:hypothetical protein